ELENGSELIRPAQLLRNDVGGDLGGQRQRESHKSEDSTNGSPGVNRCYWRSFRHPERSRGTPRNNLRRGPSTPLRSAQDDGEVCHLQPRRLPTQEKITLKARRVFGRGSRPSE